MLMLQFFDLLAHCNMMWVNVQATSFLGNRALPLLSAFHAVNFRCISGVSNAFSSIYWHETILLLA